MDVPAPEDFPSANETLSLDEGPLAQLLCAKNIGTLPCTVTPHRTMSDKPAHASDPGSVTTVQYRAVSSFVTPGLLARWECIPGLKSSLAREIRYAFLKYS